MHPVAILLGLQLLFRSVLSANVFFNPPASGQNSYHADNHVYSLGDNINIRWETDFEAMDLILWQQSNSSESHGAWVGSQYFERAREKYAALDKVAN